MPRHLVLVGLMASGKTTIGRQVASRLGWPFVDSDEQLEARTGQTARDVQQAQGRDALHREELAVLEAALREVPPSVIAGAASVVDTARGRTALRERARVVWLDAPPDVLAARAAEAATRRHGDHRPDADEATLRQQREQRLGALLDLGHDIVDVDRPARDVVAEIVGLIREPGVNERPIR